ncbi:MAG: hypothetical protein LUF33_02300 [Clostridiales bacterium]|nr:hypothetical protein [Clostridiales bacterium]
MRATKYKHYSSGATTKATSEHKTHKAAKKVKILSYVCVITFVAVALIIPTTTLAPDVDAFEDSKAASYSIGDIDAFSSVITENCVPETSIATIQTTVATEETTKATEAETTEAAAETQPAVEETTVSVAATQATEPAESSKVVEAATSETNVSTDSSASASDSSGSYLVDISNPDSSYSPSAVTLSDYDRDKLERLVMGEAGSLGYTGCALVAQAIRDAMNRSNTTSIDKIISDYQYYGSTSVEPTQTVKNAVSYIFDENGSAVQHRILCFYTGTSEWHETQTFIVGCGSVRFFDYS